VFPLKGKLLNVRDASVASLQKNEEIQNIIKILGIQMGTVYKDTKTLRYGSLMIMADQDHDGSHIKGLIINFIHHFWPSLVKMNTFMKEFVTPIIKI
jgi:DNA topoisomerase-2